MDSCNYSDEQQSQWSLDNPSSSSLSTNEDGGQSSSASTEQNTDHSSPAHVPSKSESKSSKKQRRSKFDVTGDLMDKLLGMQEKSEKMMMEMEEKRVQLELDVTMRHEERNFHLKMMSIMTRNPFPSPVMPPASGLKSPSKFVTCPSKPCEYG